MIVQILSMFYTVFNTAEKLKQLVVLKKISLHL